jgi:hypothetical protein
MPLKSISMAMADPVPSDPGRAPWRSLIDLEYFMPLPHSARVPDSSPRQGIQLPQLKFRALLALDGRRLSRKALQTTVPCLHRLTDRLDILLVNPSKAPTFLLGGMLTRLERWGIDYRLTSTDGVLWEEVVRYLHRFPGISTVVLDRRGREEGKPGPSVADLQRQGHRVIALSDAIQWGAELEPPGRMRAGEA